MDEQEDLIAQFRGIADTTEERARFYLESAQWQLPVALSSFYDNPSASPVQPEDEMDVEFVPPREERSQPLLDPPAPSGGRNTKKTKTPKSSKFGSIRDLGKEEDNSSEEEGQRFYAGGSEHSGELIVGPPRKKQSNEEIAKSLFKEAKKHGAEAVEAGSAGKSGDSGPKYFGGGGYKLGESSESSEFIPGRETQQERGPVNVTLRLWSNGFTVDDGPIRDFNDPENQEFLNSIKKGEIPRELIRSAQGGEVHVDMEDRRQEDYTAPKKKLKPFTGQGHKLGSPAPTFTSSGTDLPPVERKSSSVDPPLCVDESKPRTTLQIRLSDGKRVKKEFNQTHRISDVRTFLLNSHPDVTTRPFILMTTFPNKELKDESLSLRDANLLNAMVVQKLQ